MTLYLPISLGVGEEKGLVLLMCTIELQIILSGGLLWLCTTELSRE